MSDAAQRVVVTIFEPRWHGYARWRIERRTRISQLMERSDVLEEGWMRRRRGSRCISTSAETERWQAYYLNAPDWDAVTT